MKILVIGGTGAIGVPLVNMLADGGNTVYVTSRSERQSQNNIYFIKGNGQDPDFIRDLIRNKHYDVIVDFMVRTYENLDELINDFLSSTLQYVFISSARVYAESDRPITESTPRLLDVSTDEEYLRTNEYALAKAREENLLFKSKSQNFTIIRPSITYNNHRLQLGVFEKEDWLFRALKKRTIVFSNDLRDKVTTMTHGDDVAKGIYAIIGQEDALGKAFHITSPYSLTWDNVLNIYKETLEKELGYQIKVLYTDKSTNFLIPGKKYQLVYCRYFNRSFDNSAIGQFVDINSFQTPESGLKNCLENFLKNQKFNNLNSRLEAIHDCLTGERTPITQFPNLYSKVIYFLLRNKLGFMISPLSKLAKFIKIK